MARSSVNGRSTLNGIHCRAAIFAWPGSAAPMSNRKVGIPLRLPALILTIIVTACGGPGATPPAVNSDADSTDPPVGSASPDSPFADAQPSDVAIAAALEPATGDIEEMQAKRRIRMLVTFSKTNYFLDQGKQLGATYEAGHAFEEFVNKELKTRNLRIHVVFVPVSRDDLLPALQAGRGDIAAAGLTITDARRQIANFSMPVTTGVSEVIVTTRGTPPIASADDLSGRDVFVRRTSSYYDSLERLNASLRDRGKPPARIVDADEQLEDEDILEMVNAGLITTTVVDDHVARLWTQVYDQLDVHDGVTLRQNGEIAWAVRRSAPKLLALVNRFVDRSARGTTFGNVVLKRYFGKAEYLKRSTSAEDQRKFRTLIKFFRQYGGEYDFPYLLLAAQGYQESQLDQNRRSSAGAVGIMQIKPSTAEGSPVFIKGVDRSVEANIHAGAKYLRWIVDEYYKDEPMTPIDKGLFALASYNAGPGRMNELRRKATKLGLDRNKWFQNVEIVAAREIGRETVQYVGNIYKYYVAYELLVRQGFVTAADQPKKAAP
jgi:membrane-bound lytic murein transglycosylase MltF